MTDFLQRIVGYTLTGDTREQKAFILCGSGRNGKSTFLETIRYLMGCFAVQMDFRTIVQRRGDSSHSDDIAKLAGARFVSAVEIESGSRLAEVTLKQLTGSDTIAARAVWKSAIEYRPQFKLFLGTNHLPVVTESSLAIWRRLCVIPFPVAIPENAIDLTLQDKLRRELPGILRWAVEGCLHWQKDGLRIPEAAQLATERYREDMDVLSDFLSERCEFSPEARVGATELYEAYCHYCQENNEERLSQKAFANALRERQGGERLIRKRSNKGRYYWFGLGLIHEDE